MYPMLHTVCTVCMYSIEKLTHRVITEWTKMIVARMRKLLVCCCNFRCWGLEVGQCWGLEVGQCWGLEVGQCWGWK